MGFIRGLSAKEVARATGRRKETVLGWLRAGDLPATKDGRRWYVLPADLEAFLRRRARQQTEARRGSH